MLTTIPITFLLLGLLTPAEALVGIASLQAIQSELLAQAGKPV